MEPKQWVLIVEDDASARVSLVALLTAHGLAVRAFESAEALLADVTPDTRGCVLSDLRLEGMNGLDLQRELSAREIQLPCIIISGYGSVTDAIRAMQNGAIAFLEKPCSESELLGGIHQALERDWREHKQREQQAELQRRYDSLTPAELQVLDSLLAGKPNKIVAADLDIGLRTVELRRSAIMQKMHADSLAHLVRLIVQLHPSPPLAAPQESRAVPPPHSPIARRQQEQDRKR